MVLEVVVLAELVLFDDVLQVVPDAPMDAMLFARSLTAWLAELLLLFALFTVARFAKAVVAFTRLLATVSASVVEMVKEEHGLLPVPVQALGRPVEPNPGEVELADPTVMMAAVALAIPCCIYRSLLWSTVKVLI